MEIGSTEDLAKRVQREREARGLTYRGLADAMRDQGCSIQASALQRLESGYPNAPAKRPKVGVDELAALCRVFGTTPGDLLTPIELVGQMQAQRLIERTVEAVQALWGSASSLYEVARELGELVATEDGQDVAEYMMNRLGRTAMPPDGVPQDVMAALAPAVMDLLRRGVFSHDAESQERQLLDESTQLLAQVDQLVTDAEATGVPTAIESARMQRSAVLRLVQQINDNARTRP